MDLTGPTAIVGAVALILNLRNARRGEVEGYIKRVEAERDALRKERDEMREEIRQCKARIDQLEEENLSLLRRVVKLENGGH